MSAPRCPSLTSALELFRERAARHEPADPESEPYRLGLADAYADAAGLLEQMASPGWPEQSDQHPYDTSIGETA